MSTTFIEKIVIKQTHILIHSDEFYNLLLLQHVPKTIEHIKFQGMH